MFAISICLVLMLSMAMSLRIDFLFATPKTSTEQSNSQIVINLLKSRLSNLDKDYVISLRDQYMDFDYSGGLKNMLLLNICLKQIKLQSNETMVCPAVKDRHLISRVMQPSGSHNDTLYMTDEMINIRFSLSANPGSDLTHLNYIFKVFHSSTWSILLLISLLMGMLLYVLDNLGKLEVTGNKHRGISIEEAYFITYFSSWGNIVCKNLKTRSARIVLHIWQLFTLLMIVLYTAALVSLVLNTNDDGDYDTRSNIDRLAQSSKVYCSQEIETICNDLQTQYPQLNIYNNNSHSFEKDSITVVFRPEIVAGSRIPFERNYREVFHGNSIVFVSNNVAIIREINLKMLSKTLNVFESNKEINIKQINNLIALPIKLKHIFGPIMLLVVGCTLVTILSVATVGSRLVSTKIRQYHKVHSQNSKRKQTTEEEKLVECAVERDGTNLGNGRRQETEV